MPDILQKCRITGKEFLIIEEDQKFYAKMGVPIPTLCIEESRRLKFMFRNERSMYYRKCDATGKQIISIYSPDKAFIVYNQETWWGDSWDPRSYGRDFDFSRPFFEQYAELNREVPKLAIQNTKSVNCDYTNYSSENKNCYLLVGGTASEDVYYGYRILYSKNIVDCVDLYKCELCYECLESVNLYNSVYCKGCQNSSDLYFSEYCIGCQDCFGCTNLRNKKYCIFNRSYSREEYMVKVVELKKKFLSGDISEFESLKAQNIYQATNVVNSENSSGDQLINCRNCQDCFVLKNSEDCRYMIYGEDNKDCADSYFSDNCELQYNSLNLHRNYNIIAGNLIWYVKNAAYVTLCFNSNNLFGCSSIPKGEYLIMNKQYSKEDFEKTKTRIIEHMKETGEWGEFFPTSLSPFAYNETVAQEYYPITNQEAENRGYNWKDDTVISQYQGTQYDISKDISEIEDAVCEAVLLCTVTQKAYKISKPELDFYRKMRLPVPKKSPDQRHVERMARRNPRKLWDRKCAKCGVEMKTSYAPERPEIVYCETCYLSEVY